MTGPGMRFSLPLCLLVFQALPPSYAAWLDCTELQYPDSTVVHHLSNLSAVCSQSCSPVPEPEVILNVKDNAPLGFALVCAAGMSTALGASLVFFDKCVTKQNGLVLAASLGFSGGVMLYVSFVEIIVKSIDAFESCDCLWEHDDPRAPAQVMASITFFGGIIFFVFLDFVVHKLKPHMLIRRSRKEKDKTNQKGEAGDINSSSVTATDGASATSPAQMPSRDEEALDELAIESGQCVLETNTIESELKINVCSCDVHDEHEEVFVLDESETSPEEQQRALNRMGTMTALAIGLHNFPEGLATFAGTLADPSVGVGLAVAIGIHNIPEGLCVSIPIYYATGSRWRGFLLATFSGMAEIVGALLGYAFLVATFTQSAYAILFGLVAGMMVAIVASELLPTAHRYDPKGKIVNFSFFLGMAVMALSLVLFKI